MLDDEKVNVGATFLYIFQSGVKNDVFNHEMMMRSPWNGNYCFAVCLHTEIALYAQSL